MKLRPTIFLSGVSSEFASFREAVEVEVQKKGCFAENQSSFGVDYRTVEEMLRRRIGDADAVIHIVGFRFGFEPKDRPDGKPRRSYTQMEYDIARELEKPVYVFLSSDASVCDAAGEEDPEVTALQLAHRQAIKSTNNLRYTFKDKDELRHLAAEIDVVAQADFRVDISRIDKYAPSELIGREDELALLNDAWLKVRRAEPQRAHILTFVALGGEGKTSLVAKWLADLAYQNWPGCDSAFAWSFYSQGTREQYAASSDLFLKEAITFFGDAADKEFAASPAGAYEKGQRLARIVGQRRSLLILDGLEPLQYAPTSPTPGELKDGGITSLLKGLAARSDGLCIVTTRYSLPNLKTFWQTTAPEIPLTRLSQAAGIHLLKTLSVKGSTSEFEKLVEDVKGHALTLNLLGTYLRDGHAGDIRRRDLIKLEEADAEEQGGHAFRIIEAYAKSFEEDGSSGYIALAMLRLLGLFDRPMTVGCFNALLEKPVLNGLTELLVGLNEVQRNMACRRLENAKLLTINTDSSHSLVSLDAHAVVREYFARQVRLKQPDAWRAAHKRIYEYLCETTPDKEWPALEDLQPLYQAVVHGCYANLQKSAFENICQDRIWRRDKMYTIRHLGVFGSDLGAVACFFEKPWSYLSSEFSEREQAFLLNSAAYCLRALGRLTEALEPMRAAVRIAVDQESWLDAAITLSNLSGLEVVLGALDAAVKDIKQSVTYGDSIGDIRQRIERRGSQGHVLHQAGHLDEAEKSFSEAEQLLQSKLPGTLLFGRQGYFYWEFLFKLEEARGWRVTMTNDQSFAGPPSTSHRDKLGLTSLEHLHQRASYLLEAAKGREGILNVALSYLALTRTILCQSLFYGVVFSSDSDNWEAEILMREAMRGFRRGGAQELTVSGLLTLAWVHFHEGVCRGSGSAQEDLDEAWEIAERGPMRLHMADIHLYRARLFFREKEYPWESPEADLRAARKLIEQCGYWRRKEELEDAERVILEKSA